MIDSLPEMNHHLRVERLRAAISLGSDDCAFSSSLPNIRYLTGFTGSAGVLLVCSDELVLIVDGRYEDLARQQCGDHDVRIVRSNSSERLYEDVGNAIRGKKRMLVDPSQLTVDVHAELERLVGSISFVRGAIEDLRLVKDDAEIERIRLATGFALDALRECLPILEDFPTEREFRTT